MEVRLNLKDRKPGVYSTALEISGWQTEPVRVPVELTIAEETAPVPALPASE